MHAPANESAFQAAADSTVEELNRIVSQAEELLRSLGDEAGDATAAVRDRVSETLSQAKARLAASAAEATDVAESLAEQTDRYVRHNPWQSVAIAALLGGITVFLITKSARRT
jgi:ElaB/YqjD/DUF883 family membrane-anchored ribosome-binding protein